MTQLATKTSTTWKKHPTKLLVQALLAAGCGLMLNSNPAIAATIPFTGATGTPNWENGLNWAGNSRPTVNDLAIIANGLTAEVSQQNSFARDVEVNQNGVLNVTGGDLTFGFQGNGWMWIGESTPGTVNQSGGIVAGQGANTSVIIDSFGQYNISGGVLTTSDDLSLLGSAVFQVTGAPTIVIGDDLLTSNNSSTTFQFNLVGDQLPTFAVSDTMRLRGDTILSIDTLHWSGPGTISLFNVGGGITGGFADVIVDGVSLNSSEFQLNPGNIVVSVSEPSNARMAMVGVLVLGLIAMPRILRRQPRHRPIQLNLSGPNSPHFAPRLHSASHAVSAAVPHTRRGDRRRQLTSDQTV